MSRLHKALRSGVAAGLIAASNTSTVPHAADFQNDIEFLKKHTDLLVLSDRSGQAQIAVAPAWQGRVMTSTAAGLSGQSFGWINRELIASRKLQPHINVFGGEDRFWLGPEGGQFSIFFTKGAPFTLDAWQTPAAIDTMPYSVVKKSRSSVTFRASFSLTNYSNTRFDIRVERQVRLLSPRQLTLHLGAKLNPDISAVGYESVNTLANAGANPWKKDTGLLSVWILGMFNPSPTTTIVVPIHKGSAGKLGPAVTSDYFGAVPPDRLAVQENAVFFSGDGQFRSKIGVSPQRSKGVLGSYDSANKILTFVQFTQPENAVDYVNSQWKIQENPYRGDASNSYNDGPPSPGAKPLGPFYELESSSPAAALAPGKHLTHTHRTLHLTGPESQLNPIAQQVLGISLADIQKALPRR